MSAWPNFTEQQTVELRRALNDPSLVLSNYKSNTDKCNALLNLLPTHIRNELGAGMNKDRLLKKIVAAHEAEKTAGMDEYLLPAESSTEHPSMSAGPSTPAPAASTRPITEEPWFKAELAKIDGWTKKGSS